MNATSENQDNRPRKLKQALVVLGMHRSGTSAFTRVLSLCGASLPQRLMKPIADDNETGFWEPSYIVKIHDELLASAGSSWDDFSEFPQSWFTSAIAAEFKQQLLAALKDEFADAPLFVLKDPRICRIVPFWLNVLAEFDAVPSFVISIRNPLEVAASLKRRNGFDLAKSLLLWLQHFLSAERATRNLTRSFVTYDKLLCDWRSVVSQVETNLQCSFPCHSHSVAVEIEEFLRFDLRHHHETLTNLSIRPDIVNWVSVAFDWATRASNGDAVSSEELDAVRCAFLEADKAYGPIIARSKMERVNLKSKIDHLLGEVQARDSQIAQLSGEVKTRDSQIAQLSSEVKTRDSQIAQLSSEVKTRDSQIAQLSSEVKTRDGEIAAIHRSTSWKASAPIRIVGKQVKDLRPSTLGRRLKVPHSLMTFQLGKRFRHRKVALLIGQSGLFDANYYLASNPDVMASGADPLLHYLDSGAAEGRNPNPLFDTSYYLKQNPDVAKAGMNPLVHYLSCGAAEGRNPNPLFNTSYYLKQNPDVAEAGINPLAHYISCGAAEGRNPNPGRVTPVSLEVASVLKQTALNKSFIDEACNISFPVHAEPEVSVLIPVHNNLPYTLRCLKALTYQDANTTFEVILVDDQSTDATEEIVQRIRGIKYIRNLENLGFLHSCNTASLAASGRFLVLLNNDTAPLSNWLKELIKPFKMDPCVGVVGSMLLYPNGLLQEAGALIWKDGSGWNYGRTEDPNACEYNFVRETDYCSAASIAIPLNLWKQLQGFDPLFEPAYYEDTDLAFRVREANFKVLYNPFSKVVHFEGVSSGNNLTSGAKRYQLLNQPRFAERWKEEIKHNEVPKSAKPFICNRYNQRLMLWIDSTTPTPDQDSGSGDVINFFSVVLNKKWGVSFIPFNNYCHAGRYTEALQRLGVECLYFPYIKSVESYLKIHGSKFDIVVLSRVKVAEQLVHLVRKYAPQAKLIFNTIDLHFLRYERELQLFGDANADNAVTEARDTELQVVRNSDLTIVISEPEAKIIKSLEPSARLCVIPILREIPGRCGTFSERRDICFLGGFNHLPNVDAVKFFTSSIWPLVAEKLPDCRFIIAGSNVPAEIQSLESDSVIVRGFVPNLKELFDNVRISVAPLRYGAGMKGKVVSSLSYGVPVVATTIAAEGMSLTHGDNAMIADEVDDFADWLVQAYSSEELWTKLSDAGLVFAESNFSIEAVGPKIITMLNSLMKFN